MEVFMLGERDDYAGYGVADEADSDRHGFLTDRVILPKPGAPPIAFREGFGDADVNRRPKKKGDYHTGYGNIRLFSQRAVDALGDTLTKSGDLFPVRIENRDEPFYWYWCTTIIDCIDESKTKRGPPSNLPIERRLIMTPGFHLDRIGTHEIFVVPGQSRQFDMFITDAFRDRVAAAKLKGFKLGKGRFDPKPWIS